MALAAPAKRLSEIAGHHARQILIDTYIRDLQTEGVPDTRIERLINVEDVVEFHCRSSNVQEAPAT